MICSVFSPTKTTHSYLHTQKVKIVWKFSVWKENGMKLHRFFKCVSTEFSLYLFGVERGHREGKERARRGKPIFALSLPSPCSLYRVSLQRKNGSEIRTKLRGDKLHKMKQTKQRFGFRTRIGCIATRRFSAGGERGKGKALAFIIHQKIVYFIYLNTINL